MDIDNEIKEVEKEIPDLIQKGKTENANQDPGKHYSKDKVLELKKWVGFSYWNQLKIFEAEG